MAPPSPPNISVIEATQPPAPPPKPRSYTPVFSTYTEEEISVWDDIDRARAERGWIEHMAEYADEI